MAHLISALTVAVIETPSIGARLLDLARVDNSSGASSGDMSIATGGADFEIISTNNILPAHHL